MTKCPFMDSVQKNEKAFYCCLYLFTMKSRNPFCAFFKQSECVMQIVSASQWTKSFKMCSLMWKTCICTIGYSILFSCYPHWPYSLKFSIRFPIRRFPPGFWYRSSCSVEYYSTLLHKCMCLDHFWTIGKPVNQSVTWI